MKLYFRGGKISKNQRLLNRDDIRSIKSAPEHIKVGIYRYKLHYLKSIDNNLIYDCINDNAEFCHCCSGKGEIECPTCQGFGTIDCEECDGQGGFEKEAEENKKTIQLNKKLEEEFKKSQTFLEFI